MGECHTCSIPYDDSVSFLLFVVFNMTLLLHILILDASTSQLTLDVLDELSVFGILSFHF